MSSVVGGSAGGPVGRGALAGAGSGASRAENGGGLQGAGSAGARRAGLAGSAGGTSSAGAFDAVMASEAVPGSSPKEGESTPGAQPALGSWPSTSQLSDEMGRLTSSPEVDASAHVDASLPVRRFLPSSGQQAVEVGVPEAVVSGFGVAVDSLPALSGALPSDASLRIAPNARHDSQQTPEADVLVSGPTGAYRDVGMSGSARVEGDVGVSGTPSATHLDASLSARRFLPSNGQQAVEMGVPETAVSGLGVAVDALPAPSGALPSDASLPSVPKARHDSQQAPEPGVLVSAGPAGVYVAAGVSGLAPVEGAVGVSGTPSATHLDASLPDRRFLPSNGQQAVETGMPEAVVAGFGVAVDALPAPYGALQSDASLPSVPGARPVSQQTPESGVPWASGLGGAAGLAGSAGTAGLVAASGPQPNQPTPSSSAGVGLGTASALSPALQFDGSLHDRRFLPSNQQGSIESGPVQALQVTQAAQVTPTQPAPPQLNTVPPAPLPLASQPQPALTPQLAAPLFSLATAAPGEHVMTLRVAPDDLGPLTVRAHIDAAGVRIELFAPGDAGRDAVRHVLPELRRSLEDSGASLSLSSQNSPPDAGKDPGQGNGRDPGQGTGQGAGPGNGTRDPDTRPRGSGESGAGEPGSGAPQPGSGEGGPEGTDAQPQLPPGVVRGLSTPNRLDILV